MPVLSSQSAQVHQMHGATFTSLASPTRGSHDNSVWQVAIAPSTPPTTHQVTREEIFVVLSGRGRVMLGDELVSVAGGDVIVVPPDTDFALEALGTEPLRAMVCFPVGGQARLHDGTTFTPPWAQ